MNDEDGWEVAELQCRICGHVTVSVHPAEMPEPNNLQCPMCGNMTMEAVEEEQ